MYFAYDFMSSVLRGSWWRHRMEIFSALLSLCAGSSVNSPHENQWRGALMFCLICALTNGLVNNRDAGGLRRNCAHYEVTVTCYMKPPTFVYHLEVYILVYFLVVCTGIMYLNTVGTSLRHSYISIYNNYNVHIFLWHHWFWRMGSLIPTLINFNPSKINYYTNYEMCDEITSPFPNFTGSAL